jgi:ATP:ADP antiporter, AAA family
MKERLLTLLGIKSGEESVVTLLLFQSACLGIFLGAFDISAHSLFLSVFDEKMMARGYIVSGFTGLLFIYFYSWLRERMEFRKFASFNLGLVTSLTALAWIAIAITPAPWIFFIAFILLGPLNILAMLVLRATTQSLSDTRQLKKVYSISETGLYSGIILVCFVIPLLLSAKLDPRNILLISVISAMIATLIQQFPGSGLILAPKDTKGQNREQEKPGSLLQLVCGDKFTGTIFLFIIFSVITAFFIQYSFMAVTRQQYPSAADMARFLSVFTGSMMVFALFVRFVVFPYLIRNFKLRTSLAISPVLIAVVTVTAIVAGMAMGYTKGSPGGFIIFFFLLALCRFFSRSLRESLEFPSLKVIYLTLDEKLRYRIKSGLDSAVNETAVVSVGLLLSGIGILSFIRLMHFSWILILVILFWLALTLKLYSGYRKMIRKSLSADDPARDAKKRERRDFMSRFYADLAFRADRFSLISGNYPPFDEIDNKWYFRNIFDYSENYNDISLIPALKKIAASENIGEKIRNESSELVRYLEEYSANSGNFDNKLFNARKILTDIRLPQTTGILRLLRDSSIESKRLAIYMIGKFRLSEMLPEVSGCIKIRGLERDVIGVLEYFDGAAADELEDLYLKSAGNIYASKHIFRLFCKMCNEKSNEFLFERLWSNSRQLREIAVECLVCCGFKSSDDEKKRLNLLISDITGLVAWNISAKICLEKNNDQPLLGALRKEIRRWNNFLFSLLSVTYDPQVGSKIRENIESETIEGVKHAVEMTDTIADDSIRQNLTSLIKILPEEKELQSMNSIYQGDIPEYSDLIDDILNHDYHFLGVWIRACALRNIKNIDRIEITESVIALLFSPEKILQEEAGKLLSRSGDGKYEQVLQRIPEVVKMRLEQVNGKDFNDRRLLYDKTAFLSSCFAGIYEDHLLSLAENMKYYENLSDAIQEINENCLVWSLSDDCRAMEVFVHYNTRIDPPKTISDDNISVYTVSLNDLEEFIYRFPEHSEEVFSYIDSIDN